jgi:hypothetical protein
MSNRTSGGAGTGRWDHTDNTSSATPRRTKDERRYLDSCRRSGRDSDCHRDLNVSALARQAFRYKTLYRSKKSVAQQLGVGDSVSVWWISPSHASLSRQAGIDPKLVADQLGHGLGVNLDVYTVAALNQRQEAVQALETTLIRA